MSSAVVLDLASSAASSSRLLVAARGSSWSWRVPQRSRRRLDRPAAAIARRLGRLGSAFLVRRTVGAPRPRRSRRPPRGSARRLQGAGANRRSRAPRASRAVASLATSMLVLDSRRAALRPAEPSASARAGAGASVPKVTRRAGLARAGRRAPRAIVTSPLTTSTGVIPTTSPRIPLTRHRERHRPNTSAEPEARRPDRSAPAASAAGRGSGSG